MEHRGVKSKETAVYRIGKSCERAVNRKVRRGAERFEGCKERRDIFQTFYGGVINDEIVIVIEKPARERVREDKHGYTGNQERSVIFFHLPSDLRSDDAMSLSRFFKIPYCSDAAFSLPSLT